ncbi:hypothetical protein BX666DRAFT_1942587, partial [Dichotomocladium elegans]
MHPYITDHEVHNYSLHRKLRLSAYINQSQSDARLVRMIRHRFGRDTVLVMGNRTAPMAHYHEPIRNKGWREMFKRHALRPFKRVPNPRPWQRAKRPEVKCHGLLRCTNLDCLKSMEELTGLFRPRLWNRDTA